MSSLSNTLAIDSFYNKPKPNLDLLRALVKEVYQPMTKLELDSFLDKARNQCKDFCLNSNNGDFISFTDWFDQLTGEKPDTNFIKKLTEFSKQKMDQSMKDLVGFFKLDRFCELRSLFAALKIFPRAYLTCPNSASDAQKTDLVLLQDDNAFNIQVKAAKKKKSTTAGLKVLERVKDLDLSALIQKLKSLINP
jgi:hypothetical protein